MRSLDACSLLPVALTATLALLAGSPAVADPIRVTIPGLGSDPKVPDSFVVNDGKFPSIFTTFSGVSPSYGEYDSTDTRTKTLDITFQPIGPNDSPSDQVVVHLSGQFTSRTYRPPNENFDRRTVDGSFMATDTSGWTPDSKVPWPLIEPLFHENALQVSTNFTGGGLWKPYILMNYFPSRDPLIPAPVPEPSSLAALALGMGALVVRARLRMRAA